MVAEGIINTVHHDYIAGAIGLSNTHSQIDTHIANAALHFTEASIDHVNIQNIGSNTHAQIDTFIATTVPNTYVPYTGAIGTVNLGAQNLVTTGDIEAATMHVKGILTIEGESGYPQTIGTSGTNFTITATNNMLLAVGNNFEDNFTVTSTNDILLQPTGEVNIDGNLDCEAIVCTALDAGEGLIQTTGNLDIDGTATFGGATNYTTIDANGNIEMVMGGNPYTSQLWLNSAFNVSVDIDRGATNRWCDVRFQTAAVTKWAVGIPDSDSYGDGSDFFIGQTAGGASPAVIIDTSNNVLLAGDLTCTGNISGTDLTVTGNMDISNGQSHVYLQDAADDALDFEVSGEYSVLRLHSANSNTRCEMQKLSFNTNRDSGAATANEVSLSGYDIGAGNRALSISQEYDVIPEIVEALFSHVLPVTINQATKYIMLTDSLTP